MVDLDSSDETIIPTTNLSGGGDVVAVLISLSRSREEDGGVVDEPTSKRARVDDASTLKEVVEGESPPKDSLKDVERGNSFGRSSSGTPEEDRIAQGLGDLHHSSSKVQVELKICDSLTTEIARNTNAGKRLEEMKVQLKDVNTSLAAREKECADLCAKNQVLKEVGSLWTSMENVIESFAVAEERALGCQRASWRRSLWRLIWRRMRWIAKPTE
ncbi:uncharacterized protein G2W53_018323 [Senna tora]|uniref:Uncharacterized protein n=1 Tax=Senna tora TaxID=362788 RepID=A0A834U0C3_9FABA|nr:uncharacterized protein G2W53_018323 [Senna tora]